MFTLYNVRYCLYHENILNKKLDTCYCSLKIIWIALQLL